MVFCEISWYIDLVVVLAMLGLNFIGIFSKWLRENFGIPKNIIQTILAIYLIASLFICKPF